MGLFKTKLEKLVNLYNSLSEEEKTKLLADIDEKQEDVKVDEVKSEDIKDEEVKTEDELETETTDAEKAEGNSETEDKTEDNAEVKTDEVKTEDVKSDEETENETEDENNELDTVRNDLVDLKDRFEAFVAKINSILEENTEGTKESFGLSEESKEYKAIERPKETSAEILKRLFK